MLSNRQLFLHSIAQTSSSPLMLEIEKAEGVYLVDINGKKYIDLISGISVSNIGHRHPAVLKAIHKQLDKYMHLMVYGEYIQSPQIELAEKLKNTLPKRLDNLYFVNSGSEATEGAMKLVKRYTGRTEIISYKQAYHGSTQGALSLMGDEYFKQSYRPLLPDTKQISLNDFQELALITSNTAAVFIEPIQGEAGVRIPNPEYMLKLRTKCSEMGALLVVDEIQTGFGRTGKFWAFEHFNIEPDIILTAKGMGGGMPIGAFIAPKEIMASLSFEPVLGHITTFGGHPVSCAAAAATVDVLVNEKLIESVFEKEAFIRSQLIHPSIKEIRSKGLLIAVEFENYTILKAIIDKAIEKGLITDWFLFCDNSMRIAPPLTITIEELKVACSIILESINEVVA